MAATPSRSRSLLSAETQGGAIASGGLTVKCGHGSILGSWHGCGGSSVVHLVKGIVAHSFGG